MIDFFKCQNLQEVLCDCSPKESVEFIIDQNIEPFFDEGSEILLIFHAIM